MSEDEKQPDTNAGPDIEVDITNGKTVRINLSPLEWVIVMGGASIIAMVTGVAL